MRSLVRSCPPATKEKVAYARFHPRCYLRMPGPGGRCLHTSKLQRNQFLGHREGVRNGQDYIIHHSRRTMVVPADQEEIPCNLTSTHTHTHTPKIRPFDLEPRCKGGEGRWYSRPPFSLTPLELTWRLLSVEQKDAALTLSSLLELHRWRWGRKGDAIGEQFEPIPCSKQRWRCGSCRMRMREAEEGSRVWARACPHTTPLRQYVATNLTSCIALDRGTTFSTAGILTLPGGAPVRWQECYSGYWCKLWHRVGRVGKGDREWIVKSNHSQAEWRWRRRLRHEMRDATVPCNKSFHQWRFCLYESIFFSSSLCPSFSAVSRCRGFLSPCSSTFLLRLAILPAVCHARSTVSH